VITDGKKAIDHHRNAIQTFCQKYSKTLFINFEGRLDLNLEEQRNKYNKVVLLSAIRERPEDAQIRLYQELQRIWQNNIIIFYVKSSRGGDYSLPDYRETQLNLDLQDYSDRKVDEKLRDFFDISSVEEFRGTICLSVAFLLLTVLLHQFSQNQTNLQQTNMRNLTQKFFSHYNPQLFPEQSPQPTQNDVKSILKRIKTDSTEKNQPIINIAFSSSPGKMTNTQDAKREIEKLKRENIKLKRQLAETQTEIENLKSKTLVDHFKQSSEDILKNSYQNLLSFFA
jgi:hypothetical protein